ncbi:MULTISPECIES: biopolymer transporter ExbD [unclassified Campylobacter]|uniref:biopolymer transporter ExbD n=1 Tax=unclassified Campylobacter TaxID=2593542 RepID=UPI0022E9BA24|nr:MULTISPECIES: biopolymer transporter ExbD [unclassified Campylobacter]MDA3079241.1 biopolymer transporter ExbD [Campylobacter sp. CS_NA2]MDA3080456.1 biopolymer transporter ExbD [Campylobacter sp. CS_NA1]MDA3085339.1 biopolymer transporter ExbD [Campylobacter sp. CS_ED1]MDA3090116.1 biopolymer transporter ExbD [Campylobacter sp. CS_ED2]WBR51346.1 biopolymer transporter ExbD [Campylobacter sp. CS_NA3]
MIKVENEVELSDINVTPFIDVMLVLLVIFMVVTPLMTSSVKVELPKATNSKQDIENKPIILYLNQDDEIIISQKVVNLEQIGENLDELSQNDKEKTIFLQMDKSTNYERLMQIVQSVKQSGYNKIALSMEIKNE